MYYGPLGGLSKNKSFLLMSIWKLIYMKYNYVKTCSLDNIILICINYVRQVNYSTLSRYLIPLN